MLRFLLAVALGGTTLLAQSQTIEVSLERNQNGVWKSIDPGLVLDQGDLLRFRFRTTFNGYLYVIDSGTSGTQSLLFPGDATGRNNRVQAGKDYYVPSTSASFQVSGPAGHDVVYWLVSPVPLGSSPAPTLGSQPESRPTGTLIPRCDDSIFRARGLCIDSSAGPRNIGPQEELPPGLPRVTSRELVIVQNKDTARVSAPSALTGPVIYEFRVAHR
jgi:hypothetical protein